MGRNGQQSIFRQYLPKEITSGEHPGRTAALTERARSLITAAQKNSADLSAGREAQKTVEVGESVATCWFTGALEKAKVPLA